jgi:sec-independent protein translocase protein TatB
VLNIDGSEFIFIAVIALLVLGPERMPQLVRKVGKIVGELRRMSSGFQAEFRDAFAEPISAVNDLKSTMNATATDFRQTVQSAASFDKGEGSATGSDTASDTASPYMAPASWSMPDPATATELAAPGLDAPAAGSQEVESASGSLEVGSPEALDP